MFFVHPNTLYCLSPTKLHYQNEKNYHFDVVLTFFAHANDSEHGSQYLKAAEAGDRRAQYFLADSWFSSGDLSKAEYWAQKAADSGDADACALLAQIKITNPVSLDYPQAKCLPRKQRKRAVKKVK